MSVSVWGLRPTEPIAATSMRLRSADRQNRRIRRGTLRSSGTIAPQRLELGPACSLDALQALLAALADRDQLGLDLPAAFDRQADGIGVGASGHASVQLLRSGAREGGWLRRSVSQTVASDVSFILDQQSASTNDEK